MMSRLMLTTVAMIAGMGSAHAQSQRNVQMISGWALSEDSEMCALIRTDGAEVLKFAFGEDTDVLFLSSPAINRLNTGDQIVLSFRFRGTETVGGIGFVQGSGNDKLLGVIANPDYWLDSFRKSDQVTVENYQGGAELLEIPYTANADAAYDAYLGCRSRKKA